MDDVRDIVGRLSEAERKALLTLPLPRDADPVRWIAARTYGSLWRKSSKHWSAMLSLERNGLVERTVSRGETLWRPTRQAGLTVRALLSEEQS